LTVYTRDINYIDITGFVERRDRVMATFLMFGKYSPEAYKEMSAERTEKAKDLIVKHGGELKAAYVLLGEKDVVLIVDFPGVEEVIKTSVALLKMTGISFATSQAITVEEFDKICHDL